MPAPDFWTNERIAHLTELWSAGWTASRIAAELGCSRNAVLGKRMRLGLPKREKDAWRQALGDRRQKQRPALKRVVWRPKPRLAYPRLDDPSGQIEPLHLTLLDLRDGQCRWPYGEGPFTFCGCTTLIGSSYCPTHAAAAIKRLSPQPEHDERQAA